MTRLNAADHLKAMGAREDYDARFDGLKSYELAIATKRAALNGFAPVRLVLPYPPSGWDLYTGWGKQRRLSSSYRKWREDCGHFIRGRNEHAISVPFSCHIALKRPNKRQDIDNRSKAVLDALQHYGIIKNDNLCERLVMVFDAGLSAECVVLVTQFEEGIAA